MKSQYRIRMQYKQFENKKTRTLYIPEYRNFWTLFIWRKLSMRSIYSTKEEAETAIKIHSGALKTIVKYTNYEKIRRISEKTQ